MTINEYTLDLTLSCASRDICSSLTHGPIRVMAATISGAWIVFPFSEMTHDQQMNSDLWKPGSLHLRKVSSHICPAVVSVALHYIQEITTCDRLLDRLVKRELHFTNQSTLHHSSCKMAFRSPLVFLAIAAVYSAHALTFRWESEGKK